MSEGTAHSDQGTVSKPTLLKALLLGKHWQSYPGFRRQYLKAAAKLDKELAASCPSSNTFYRWTSGRIKGLPRPDTCAVLEAMLPGYTAAQLFGPPPVVVADASSAQSGSGTAPLADTNAHPAAAGHGLSITGPTVPAPADTDPRTTSAADKEDNVNRRKSFAVGAAAVAAAVAPSLVLTSSEPTRVSAADVERYRANLAHLRALDDHYGANDELYTLTVNTATRLGRILGSASYTPAIGDQLRSVAGDAMEHAGWLAFDQHRDTTRHWWLEAMHAARMANDSPLEAHVLAVMSYAASYHGRGREAAQLAAKAAQIARRDQPSPRLLSLLAANEALGHAYAGDAAVSRRAFDLGEHELNRGAHDSDPPWASFFGPSDLANHASRAALGLGDLQAAERSAREALATVDAARYPRSWALYQTRLAAVLIARRNLDEGIPLVTGAAAQTAEVKSARLASEVWGVVTDLRAHHSDVRAVRELVEWTTANLPAREPA